MPSDRMGVLSGRCRFCSCNVEKENIACLK
nr:MAG TPA: hypothetical protein [Caudoviricetes sp.]